MNTDNDSVESSGEGNMGSPLGAEGYGTMYVPPLTIDEQMANAVAVDTVVKPISAHEILHSEVSSKILNFDNVGDHSNEDSVFLTEDMGLFDTVNRRHQDIWDNYKEMKALDWDEQEFGFADAAVAFETVAPAITDRMRHTLGWQWEGDTQAARALASIASNFIGCSELSAAWIRIADNENLHAATYSEIVRLSMPSANDPIHEIIKQAETRRRLSATGKILSACHKRSLQYGLGLVPNDQETYDHAMLFTTAMLLLERVQFMASFAVTFAIGRIEEAQGFMPIVKAVQKICQDELEVHVGLDKLIIANELKTVRGKRFLERQWETVTAMIREVVNSEVEWAQWLLVEDPRELPGLPFEDLRDWIHYSAADVYRQFGFQTEFPMPAQVNVLEWIGDFLDISKTQSSPQEQQNIQYKTNIMRRDDAGVTFSVAF